MMNIENNVTVKEWMKDFSEIISRQTGFPLKAENIFSDEKDWKFYITKNSLNDNLPLLLLNCMGEMMAVIPEQEYKKLDSGEIWPFEYIPKVRWYYGQYLENMEWVSNVFWQPIEKRPGINDKRKISRYLNILKCRIDFYRTTQMPSDGVCENCQIEKCPFSMLNSKKEDSDWKNEIDEHDYREDLFDAMKERVKEELKLEVVKCSYYTGTRALLIMPTKYCETTKDHVELYLPIKMLNYLMYNPVYRNWRQYANSFLIEIGVEGNEDRVIISNDNSNAFKECREKFEILYNKQVLKKEPVREEVATSNNEEEPAISELKSEEDSKKSSVFERMKNFFFAKK